MKVGDRVEMTEAARGFLGFESDLLSYRLPEFVHGRERARTLFSGNKVNISPNKRNAFVLSENYIEGVKIFTLTAYRNDRSSTAQISVGDFWRRNADRVDSALWTD
jgi:hypothetical protein